MINLLAIAIIARFAPFILKRKRISYDSSGGVDNEYEIFRFAILIGDINSQYISAG
jgi:hypothetical protein